MPDARPAPIVLPSLPDAGPPIMDTRLSLLVYGPSGVGKTWLCGTAEDDERCRRVAFIDAEGGRATISQRGKRGSPPWLTFHSIGDDFSSSINQILAYFSHPDVIRERPYTTIVIDSLTDIASRAMDAIMREQDEHRAKPREVAGVPESADWITFTSRMERLIRVFRDLRLHLIMTALEEEEAGKAQPLFPGKKVATLLPAYFNTVGRLSVERQPAPDGSKTPVYIRTLTLQGDSRVTAKDRSPSAGKLPRTIEDPTITALLDRMALGTHMAIASSSNDENGES